MFAYYLNVLSCDKRKHPGLIQKLSFLLLGSSKHLEKAQNDGRKDQLGPPHIQLEAIADKKLAKLSVLINARKTEGETRRTQGRGGIEYNLNNKAYFFIATPPLITEL